MNYEYKRLDHVKKKLSLFNSPLKNIPSHIIATVKQELNNTPPTRDNVKLALKKHGLQRFYEDIISICIHIDESSIQIPRLSPELEQQIINLFTQIIHIHKQLYPNESFPAHSFIFYKLFHTLGHTEFLPFFPQLKSKSKKNQSIWNNILPKLSFLK